MDSDEFERDPFYSQACSAQNYDISSDSESAVPRKMGLKVKITATHAKIEDERAKKHFCGVCKKEFSSGKAYGGHVRIHSNEQKNKKKQSQIRGTVKKIEKQTKRKTKTLTGDVEIKCCLCGKEFGSMHSLFGHMRRHPDRSWKGIRPPNSHFQPAGSSSSLCSSFLENDQVEELDDDLVSYGETMEEVSEEVEEAAYCLMKLAYGASDRKLKKIEITTNPNDDHHFEDKGSARWMKKGKHDQRNAKRSGAGKMLEFDLNEPYIDPDSKLGGFNFDQIYGY